MADLPPITFGPASPASTPAAELDPADRVSATIECDRFPFDKAQALVSAFQAIWPGVWRVRRHDMLIVLTRYTKAAPPRHSCRAAEHSRGGLPAIDHCEEDTLGRFWVMGDEYSNQVPFCPFCGDEAPVGPGEPNHFAAPEKDR